MPNLSPGLKKVLLAVGAAVAALVTYLTQACTPAQVAKADRAFDAARTHLDCVQGVERAYADLALEPESATPARAAEALRALRACAKSDSADAGGK